MEQTIWRIVISAAMLGYGAYLWVQARKVDAIYQALFGINGRNGIFRRIEWIEGECRTVNDRITATRHDINNKMAELITKQYLNFEKIVDDLKSDFRSKK